jgi:hypothetical protein
MGEADVTSGAVEHENDIDQIKRALRDQENLIRLVITKIETRIPMVDGFDDRLSRAEGLARSLTNTSLKLAAIRGLTSWVPGAVAGAVAGATVAWIMLSSGIAGAH